jgi:hypothetical protein
MIKAIRKSANLFLAIAAMLLLFSAGLSGQETAGFSTLTNRPANVPTEYVITPFGYFHPSCVLLLEEGNTLLADGGVQHADGTVEAAQVCGYPHYTASGVLVTADTKASGIDPLTINGWIESVSATTSSSYYKISATWTVPPVPKSDDGQCDYFFPGFEDSNDVLSIVQPVLQWGKNCTPKGANHWQIASWNCCISGTQWYSPLLNVTAGDTILGTISPTCKAGNDYCAKWNVVSEDKTTGKKTTLAKTAAEGQIWNWAFGAVTEDYDVVQCSDFPDNSKLTFTVQLYDQNGNIISDPNWQGTQWQSGPPDCNYGWTITKTKETVKY